MSKLIPMPCSYYTKIISTRQKSNAKQVESNVAIENVEANLDDKEDEDTQRLIDDYINDENTWVIIAILLNFRKLFSNTQ